MGQAKLRKAEIDALKAPKAPKFYAIIAFDSNLKEFRGAIRPANTPILDMFDIMGDADVCRYKVSEYIKREDDLTSDELFHFTNWCAGVYHANHHMMKNGQFDKCGGVFANVIGTNTVEDAQAFITQTQNDLFVS